MPRNQHANSIHLFFISCCKSTCSSELNKAPAHDLKHNKQFKTRAVEQSACSDIYRQEVFIEDLVIDSVAQVSIGNEQGSLK